MFQFLYYYNNKIDVPKRVHLSNNYNILGKHWINHFTRLVCRFSAGMQKNTRHTTVFLCFFELTDKKSDYTICANDLISVSLIIKGGIPLFFFWKLSYFLNTHQIIISASKSVTHHIHILCCADLFNIYLYNYIPVFFIKFWCELVTKARFMVL